MERCPNCRARLDGAEQCRRCGLELAGLRAVERAAGRFLGLACAHLAADERAAALVAIRRARALYREPFGAALRAFVENGSAHGP